MRFTIAILAMLNASKSASSSSDFKFTEYDEGSSNPKFNFVKHFGEGNTTFSKMTGRFYFGDKQETDQTFFATYWAPGERPMIQPRKINALIFVVHGYAEYLSNDYDEIARHWSQQVGGGALVFGHDHAGHGRTTVGKRALITDMRDFTGPIIAHVKEIQKLIERSDKKLSVFIAGHSMGGLISLNTILEQPELFNGFIGIGPLVKISPSAMTPAKIFAAKLLAKFWPSFGHPLIDGINIELITRNEAQWEIMENDPLRYHGGTKAGMAWLMMKETEKLQKNLNRIELPILVLQGGSDQILDPEGARMLYKNASSSDKEYKEYPGAYHQLLVELKDVRDDVIERTTKWLNDRIVL